MNLKKVVILSLSLVTLLTNAVTVEAKAKPNSTPITPKKYWTKVHDYTNEIVKGCLTNTDLNTPPEKNPDKNYNYIFLTNDTTLSDPMAVYEYFYSGGTRSYYTRRSKVSTKVTKPDSNGYVDTTVTFKILENLIHKPSKGTNYITEVGKVYDIYNQDTLNSYEGYSDTVSTSSSIQPYNDDEEKGAVFTQVLDRYTGTNLMSGLKDVVDSNGVEFKNACEFKAKGKKWIVQVDAKKTAPTKNNPYGTLVFKVHHHKDYKGLAFGQFLAFSVPIYKNFSGNVGWALASVDYSKRFKLADFMSDGWLHGDYTLVKYK